MAERTGGSMSIHDLDDAYNQAKTKIRRALDKVFEASKCPACGLGTHGKDPLCDKHWKKYLGTHVGGRGEEGEDKVFDEVSNGRR